MPVTNLPCIQQEIIRYGITVYFALGLVGNIFNCVMFTRRPYRRTPSSVYLLFLSIFGIIYLLWTMAPLVYTLNYPDLQTQSVVYCKVRLYGSHTLALFLRYSVVCACADRFFVTRTNARLRSLSSVHTAKKLLFTMCVGCTLIAIHIPILMDIRNGICGMIGIYKLLYAVYQILVITILPPLLMSIFSILTIRSLHQRHHAAQVRLKKRDRDLLRMVTAEVMVTVLSSIPYSATLVYGAWTYSMTGRSAQRLEIESFVVFITQVIVYFLGVAPFYLFLTISKPFRNDFLRLFANFWHKYIIVRAQVVPFNHQNDPTTNHLRVVRSRQ